MAATTPPTTADPRLKAVVVAIKRHRARPDSLLEVLHRVQEVFGHLPTDVSERLAYRGPTPNTATFAHAASAECGRLILRDGTTAHLRPIRPDDRAALDAFFREMSPATR